MTTYKDTDLREALRRKYTNTPQLPSNFMNRMQQAAQPKRPHSSLLKGQASKFERFTFHSSLFTRRIAAAVFSIAAALLIAFLVWPESHKETTTQTKVQPVVAEADPQPALQPIDEETKEELQADVQPAPQSEKKHRKVVRKQSAPVEPAQIQSEQPIQEQGKDIEPMYAQADEHVTHYQTIQTVYLSSDVVVYVIEASDMPAASTVPSVSELRTRGLRLTNNVRQASQTTVK